MQLLVKVVVSIETALKYVYIESVVVAGMWMTVFFSKSCLGSGDSVTTLCKTKQKIIDPNPHLSIASG